MQLNIAKPKIGGRTTGHDALGQQAARCSIIFSLLLAPAFGPGCHDDNGTPPAKDSGNAALDGLASADLLVPVDSLKVPVDLAAREDGPWLQIDTLILHKDLLLPHQDAPWPMTDTALPPWDQAIPHDQDPPLPDLGGPPSTTKVAAIQYGEGQAAAVNAGCATNPAPNLCAIKMLVLQARLGGASHVVIPEYSIIPDQQYWEPIPTVGENPGQLVAWPDDLFITIFSQYASKLGIYLVINLLTYSGTQPNLKYFNTQVAFDPAGKVVGVHHKFELFGGEKTSLTPGTDVMVFSTPLGKIGLLICADIYGSAALLNKLVTTLQARVVAFSSFWTVAGAETWQSDFAKNYGIYLIAANTTISPGQGGGVYDPTGAALAFKKQNTPSVVFADIPAP